MPEEWIGLSQHAQDRWWERARFQERRLGPRAAWAEAEPAIQWTLDADRVRHHRTTQTLLLAKRGVLVTVLNTPEPRVRLSEVRAVPTK